MNTEYTIKDIAVDWRWVEVQVLKRERIPKTPKNTIEKALKESLEKAGSLVKISSVSIEKKILNIKSDSIELEGSIELSTKWFSSFLRGARSLHIFAVTLGAPLEEAASKLMHNGDHLEGYLLDRIGSFAVESLAESFENELRRHYSAKNLSVSMRFSPGYCDWPIEEQFKLARILDFSKAGIQLTEGCMMVPKKSISAAVGIGPKDLFLKTKSQCVICDKRGVCSYRRDR